MPARPRPRRRAGRRPRRPASSSSGLVVVTTVVRPARCSRRRSAMRASVWASTAEVGSTSTSTSGSAASARASTSRWRWPPEKVRPRSATTVSSPSGSASRMSSAEAVSQGAARGASARGAGHVEPRRASRPENSARPVSETTMRRRTSARGRPVSGTPPRRDLVVGLGGAAAEPVGERGGLLGRLRDQRGEQPGPHPQAGAGVGQLGARRRAPRPGSSGSPTSGSSASTRHTRGARRPGRG